MAIKLTNVDIIGFKTAVSIPHGVELEYNGGKVMGTEFGIVQRDPPSFFAQIGLPKDTPYDVLLTALMLLRANPDAPIEKKTELLETSRLGPYLQNSANATTVVTGLAALAGSPLGAQLVTWLQGL
ncbi:MULTISPECIES: hypothetical protein [Pseudomonas]|uniref:hypothetical protein n=1 Tax=Pseudomonas TaxID=286 RepID=UPI0025AB17C9|nr:hypothetical protein [Pseudomonas asiatica]MDM9555959.1 hypothetical protein [Pseudomonas asiatica]